MVMKRAFAIILGSFHLEQGVQREWPSTITNGQKLVLMFRLPQIIFF